MSAGRQERRLTTILSADVVGYSHLMRRDESGTLATLQHLRRTEIDPRIDRHGGRIIKLIGDGTLVEFASVVDAVRFAVEVQLALTESQRDKTDETRILFRIGINIGDVIVDKEEIYGDGVNLAARVEGLADPGGICITRTVLDQVKDKLDLTFTPMGPKQVKNIPSPVEVYRVELDAASLQLVTEIPAATPPSVSAPGRGYRLWGLAAALLLLAMGLFGYFNRPESAAPPVVAVLPFHDVSADAHRGLLSDPLSDGILAHLARYPELTVIARGSSFRYRDTDRDLREIGAQLDADYLVEGSLNFDGQRILVNVALVNVNDNTQVWSDQIAKDIDDLMLVIADIGQRVAYQVEDFVGQVRVTEPGSFKADALLRTMKARRTTMRGLSEENNAAVIEMNRETISLYPEDAWGHLAMAFALRTQVRFGWADDPEATLAEAVRHGETAVRLDPGNYSAYFALGRVRMQQGDQRRAIDALETALALNPSSADALNALAQAHFYQGENEKALEILAESARIDPLPSFVHSWVSAWVLWQEERCEEASAAFARIASPPPASQKLASVIETCLGNTDAARTALETFLEATPGWTLVKETELQKSVWTFDPGRERWIQNLAEAGMPQGGP